MKHIKSYEDNSKIEYNIGDYVICSDKHGLYEDLYKYIGQIKSIEHNRWIGRSGTYFYNVKYDWKELPEKWLSGFKSYGDIGIRPFDGDNIIMSGKTAEELETKLTQSKYNL